MLTGLAETLPDMVLFVAVARAGSFSRAAKALHMPVSTLSRRISALESALSVQLIHRTTRRLALTPAGERFFERCELVVEAADAAQSELRGATEDPKGDLRVSATQDFALAYLGPVLREFAGRYPHVNVELDFTTRAVDLLADGIDVAIRIGPLPDSRLFASRLGSGSLGLYASPAFLASPLAHPTELSRHDCLRLHAQGGRPARWKLTRGEEEVTVEVTGRLVANGMRFLAEMASSGLGIAQLDQRTAEAFERRGDLVRVLPAWTPAPVPVHAVTASRVVPLRTRLFLDCLRAHLDLGAAPPDASSPSWEPLIRSAPRATSRSPDRG